MLHEQSDFILVKWWYMKHLHETKTADWERKFILWQQMAFMELHLQRFLGCHCKQSSVVLINTNLNGGKRRRKAIAIKTSQDSSLQRYIHIKLHPQFIICIFFLYFEHREQWSCSARYSILSSLHHLKHLWPLFTSCLQTQAWCIFLITVTVAPENNRKTSKKYSTTEWRNIMYLCWRALRAEYLYVNEPRPQISAGSLILSTEVLLMWHIPSSTHAHPLHWNRVHYGTITLQMHPDKSKWVSALSRLIKKLMV